METSKRKKISLTPFLLQTFAIAYYGASTLLILAAVMTLLVKTPHHKLEAHDV